MLDIFKGKVVAKDWVFVGVVLAVTLALAVLFYLLVFRTEQGKVETKRTELADLTKELNEAKRVQKDIDKLREEYGLLNYLNLFVNQQVRTGRYQELYGKWVGGDAPDLTVPKVYY